MARGRRNWQGCNGGSGRGMKASNTEFNPDLRLGEALTNEELSRRFQCSTYGGMRRSHRTNTLVLISKGSGGTYFDRWEGETFHYTGMGLTGDQRQTPPKTRLLLSLIQTVSRSFFLRTLNPTVTSYWAGRPGNGSLPRAPT